jgi:MraZ protein
MSFRGSSNNTIDPKGRIIIPVRFRDIIKQSEEQKLVISRMDGCLVVYTIEEWKNIEQKILSFAKKSANMRRFRRVFIGGSSECSIDKQNRILIPPPLRSYAHLEKDIVLAGVVDHFEIWSSADWENENREIDKTMGEDEEFNSEIAELGL